MSYLAAQPPGSTPCGTGSLIIRGATGVACAEVLARLGARTYVTVQVNQAVQQARLDDPGLSGQLGAFRDPQVHYALGPPTELSPESWSFPFEEFMSDGEQTED